ncbi:MAG: anthranilate phosphoribosyltransferase [bacterium]|nr:anthranilate phosphoribosyltransferase [bacterium]MBU1916967.1 anthranilate phosphoribosyltransferase [bacterium]
MSHIPDNIENVFHDVFTKQLHSEEIRSFLIDLHHRGESVDDILGAVRYLRKNGEQAVCRHSDLIDCCGTGGDQKNTFNISTAVGFVLAGAGCHVAKHGNVAISSQSGSADVLKALGVNLAATKEVMIRAIDEVGIGFLFAPAFYPLMQKVAVIRKSIPHRTIFNLLGPLLNPAGATKQVIGVFDKKHVPIMRDVLAALGSESVVVVSAADGTDEFSLCCDNFVSRWQGGEKTDFIFDPRQAGYPYCKQEALKGGTAQENAARLIQCLKGHSEPLDHVVHINAAWGLIVAGKTDHFLEAMLMAQDSISSGRAYRKLEELVEITNTK